MERKIIRDCVILITILLTTSGVYAEKVVAEDYEVYVDEVVKDFAYEMERNYQIVCTSIGGRMPYDVEEVDVGFWACREGSAEEARSIIVMGKQSLLNKINAHEKLRSSLREYPFSEGRALISISYVDKPGKHHKSESVTLVFEAKGKLIYCKDNPKRDILETIFE